MIIYQSDIIAKIRTAIDDIVPEASDSFTEDTDTELWQATIHAVQALLETLPLNMLEPATMLPVTQTEEDGGCGYITLEDDFLRFVALKLTTWLSPVYVLIEPGSDDEIRQRSAWGRGTPDKPKAMLTHDDEGAEILRYWTAGGAYNEQQQKIVYDHSVEILNYIPTAKIDEPEPEPQEPTENVQSETRDAPAETPAETSESSVDEPQIDCALKDEAEKLVIYQAAAIFFEGKKEPDTAEKFRNL